MELERKSGVHRPELGLHSPSWKASCTYPPGPTACGSFSLILPRFIYAHLLSPSTSPIGCSLEPVICYLLCFSEHPVKSPFSLQRGAGMSTAPGTAQDAREMMWVHNRAQGWQDGRDSNCSPLGGGRSCRAQPDLALGQVWEEKGRSQDCTPANLFFIVFFCFVFTPLNSAQGLLPAHGAFFWLPISPSGSPLIEYNSGTQPAVPGEESEVAPCSPSSEPHSLICSLIHAFSQSVIYSFTLHTFTQPLIHSLRHLFIHPSLLHALIHPFIFVLLLFDSVFFLLLARLWSKGV